MVKISRAADPGGQVVETRHLRSNGRAELGQVRAFYLDIAQWAMEEPARWGPWAAPSPVRREDLARVKEIRRRKSRMDQRTRERLPALSALTARVTAQARASAERLAAAEAVAPGEQFTCRGEVLHRAPVRSGPTTRTWSEDPFTGARRDLSGEEDRAFWTWAAIETLRHTGIRIEELSELSHHSLVQYTPPTSNELIPLLQIAPSKTDTERLLVISPELADVLAAVIHRIREPSGAVATVASYDPHERVWNPPMPLLFQRRFGRGNRAIPSGTIRDWICQAIPEDAAAGDSLTNTAGRPFDRIIGAGGSGRGTSRGPIWRSRWPMVLSNQGQLDQRGDRSLGAQHRIGQLEQRIRPHGQRGIQLAAEPGKITPPGRGVTQTRSSGVRNTGHRGHRLRLRAL